MTMYDFKELEVIETFYHNNLTERSGLPLINHIYEGLMILETICASNITKKAFCIHPIVQNDEDIDVSWSDSYGLAKEYKKVANAYLCKPENENIKTYKDLKNLLGDVSDDCLKMLLADKIQNRKDFSIHHKGKHARSKQLEDYFELWIDYLQNELKMIDTHDS